MSKGPIGEKREITAIRIPPSQKAAIKARADALGLTFTEYVIRCALGERLDATAQRLDELEQRMKRLEQMADLGAFG